MKKYKKVYVEITNKCNLNCSFCSKVKRQKKEMSIDEFKEIISKIHNYTDYIYLHVKGEPLLNNNIIEMINEAETYNIKVNLTTNGILINKFAKELGKCNNLNKINFSLHCENNKENYLEDIFNNIKYLNKNTTVIFRLWTLKNNELDKKSAIIVEKIKEEYNLPTEIVEKIKKDKNIKISSTIYVDKDNEFIWPEITNHKSCGYCYALKTHIGILVDGTVVPCCLDGEGIINLGNIFNSNMDEIISSEKYQNLKKSFQDRNPTEELCKSCTFKERFR